MGKPVLVAIAAILAVVVSRFGEDVVRFKPDKLTELRQPPTRPDFSPFKPLKPDGFPNGGDIPSQLPSPTDSPKLDGFPKVLSDIQDFCSIGAVGKACIRLLVLAVAQAGALRLAVANGRVARRSAKAKATTKSSA